MISAMSYRKCLRCPIDRVSERQQFIVIQKSSGVVTIQFQRCVDQVADGILRGKTFVQHADAGAVPGPL